MFSGMLAMISHAGRLCLAEVLARKSHKQIRRRHPTLRPRISMSPEMIPIVSHRFMLKRPFRAGESAGDGQGTARGPFRVDESDMLC